MPFWLANTTWQLNGTACTLTDLSKWEDGCLLRSPFQIHRVARSKLSWCFLRWQVTTIVECLLWLHHCWHVGHACSQWELESLCQGCASSPVTFMGRVSNMKISTNIKNSSVFRLPGWTTTFGQWSSSSGIISWSVSCSRWGSLAGKQVQNLWI